MRYLVYTLSNDDGEGDIELEILRAWADLDSRGLVDMRRGDSGVVMRWRIYWGVFLFLRYMVRVYSSHLTRDWTALLYDKVTTSSSLPPSNYTCA